jgi:putative membrane protein
MKEQRARDGRLMRLYRYLALAVAVVLVTAAALVPSTGFAASTGGGDSAVRAGADALQDLPADPGAAAGPAVDADDDCCDDGHMWDWGGGWWWLVMPIGMIVFWGGIIALIVWAVRQFSEGGGASGSAIDIARDRYARGEISQEEFDQIRRDLA